MKNKQMNKMLAIGLSVAMLSGCGGDFDPAEEEIMEVYGPPVVSEEPEEQEPNEMDEEISFEEEFMPEEEMPACVYGPAPVE